VVIEVSGLAYDVAPNGDAFGNCTYRTELASKLRNIAYVVAIASDLGAQGESEPDGRAGEAAAAGDRQAEGGQVPDRSPTGNPAISGRKEARMLVRDVMAKSTAALRPTTPIVEAAKLMASHKMGILPVLKGTNVVGVVTDRDIAVRAVAEGLDLQSPVERIMSRDVSLCEETLPVGSALDQMEREQRRRLPVISAEGKVVGLISLADAARSYDDMLKVVRVFNHVFAPGGGQTG
jgi:CBS domain-containing protein